MVSQNTAAICDMLQATGKVKILKNRAKKTVRFKSAGG